MSETKNGREVIRIGSEYFTLPTIQECEEFNRAADAFFMSRGVSCYGKPLSKRLNQEKDKPKIFKPKS
jgi:hypothetical protein